MPKTKSVMKQKLVFQRKPAFTSVLPMECYVCGKGIEDGYSVTAKTIRNDIVFFCDVHYSLY